MSPGIQATYTARDVTCDNKQQLDSTYLKHQRKFNSVNVRIEYVH